LAAVSLADSQLANAESCHLDCDADHQNSLLPPSVVREKIGLSKKIAN
jgi:hypothetical protein